MPPFNAGGFGKDGRPAEEAQNCEVWVCHCNDLGLASNQGWKASHVLIQQSLESMIAGLQARIFQFCWMHMKMGQSLAPFFSLLWKFPLPRYYSCSILGLESPEVSKLLGWIAPTLLHREWVIMTWAGKAPLSTCRTTSFWPCSSQEKSAACPCSGMYLWAG